MPGCGALQGTSRTHGMRFGGRARPFWVIRRRLLWCTAIVSFNNYQVPRTRRTTPTAMRTAQPPMKKYAMKAMRSPTPRTTESLSCAQVYADPRPKTTLPTLRALQ